MKLIGVTGNIGSGKSTVCRLLNVLGYPVYIADTEGKRITETPEITQKIRENFEDCFFENGTINRKRLAETVFSDKEKLKTLNSIIHPAVNKDFVEWTKRQHADFVFVESAILLQTDMSKNLDKIILVSSPQTTKISRASHRDKCSAADAQHRLDNQNNEAEMHKKCDFVIINDDKTAIIPQVLQILKEL